MNIIIDKESNTLYVKLSENRVIESEEVRPGMIVDFDNQNRVIGIELLNISEHVSLDAVETQLSPQQ